MQAGLLAELMMLEDLEVLMLIQVHHLLVLLVSSTQDDLLEPFPGKLDVTICKNITKSY